MRPADAATLAGGVLAGASLALAAMGYGEASLRLLMISYTMDVIDGWLARRYGGSTTEGLMLDRAFDRVSQVIVPLVIYITWSSSGYTLPERILLAVYAAGLVGVSFWRLVHRIVWKLTHFAGLPLFVHAGVLITSYISGVRLHPIILLALLAASAAPIPYTRRLSKTRSTPSPGVAPRAAITLAAALLPYNAPPIRLAAEAILAALLLYAALGALPPLLGLTPGPSASKEQRPGAP